MHPPAVSLVVAMPEVLPTGNADDLQMLLRLPDVLVTGFYLQVERPRAQPAQQRERRRYPPDEPARRFRQAVPLGKEKCVDRARRQQDISLGSAGLLVMLVGFLAEHLQLFQMKMLDGFLVPLEYRRVIVGHLVRLL